MKLQKQRNLHDPENGLWGDCDRASVASLLGKAIDDVPHFFDKLQEDDYVGIKTAFETRSKWLKDNGVTEITIVMKWEKDPESFIRYISEDNVGIPFLLIGESRNHMDHVVICKDGEIIHDPAIDNSGIIGPGVINKCYTVQFLIHKQ